ncbi:MAG: pyridoxamine 5'-phosphate oxidase family protein [Paludibacteraceae bacterium]|nr:pyridoxamine 5'-phosphate oxidase family protein [Paludibacteraceae bacterium]
MKTQFITDKPEIESLINSCQACVVSMCDTNGNPYAIPMNFAYKNDILYLHSAQEGNKIECLKQNPNVCITFVHNTQELVYHDVEMPCSYSMRSRSAIAFGRVNFVEDLHEKESAFQIFMSHYSDRTFKFGIPALKHVKVWKVEITDITAKRFGLRQQDILPNK